MSNANQCELTESDLSRNISNSGTQTSKTILQLAKLELSTTYPDSLNESPREEALRVIDYPDPMEFIRKSSLLKMISDYRSNQIEPPRAGTGTGNARLKSRKSLTQIFLEKKCQNKILPASAYYYNNFPTEQVNEKVKPLTSQTMPQLDGLNTSRFTVKGVKENGRTRSPESGLQVKQYIESRTNDSIALLSNAMAHKFVECHIKPCHRKLDRKRRSRSFMSSTFSSEQRTQNHVCSSFSFFF